MQSTAPTDMIESDSLWVVTSSSTEPACLLAVDVQINLLFPFRCFSISEGFRDVLCEQSPVNLVGALDRPSISIDTLMIDINAIVNVFTAYLSPIDRSVSELRSFLQFDRCRSPVVVLNLCGTFRLRIGL
jgi:hypothetical protein